MDTRYIAVIFDVGEVTIEAKNMAEAAQKAVWVWTDDAVLEIRREDYRAAEGS
jgi:hypothetical protein